MMFNLQKTALAVLLAYNFGSGTSALAIPDDASEVASGLVPGGELAARACSARCYVKVDGQFKRNGCDLGPVSYGVVSNLANSELHSVHGSIRHNTQATPGGGSANLNAERVKITAQGDITITVHNNFARNCAALLNIADQTFSGNTVEVYVGP
ncbi:hypothetical protein E5D57_009429 [Metarhizium anisopliae]|nr:hypothetical protein E5D57_009429 [Metarhizium anisopliae]